MFRKLILSLVLATTSLSLTSCSPKTSDSSPILGQNQSGIHVPFLFGLENGPEGLKCEPPWEGGKCLIPKSRTFKIAFLEPTCPEWYAHRIGKMLNFIQIEWGFYGWKIEFVNPTDAKYFVGCDYSEDRGLSWFNPGNSDCQNTQYGKLCKYSSGTVGLNITKIEGRPIWSTANTTQRRMWFNNVVLHEMMHLFGHGHFPGSQSGSKVMAQGFPNDLSSDAWNINMLPEPVEYAAIDCYNPAGSVESLCTGQP